MFSRLRTRLRKKLNILKEDNKGAAIVVAIVAIAFIGMLVGMLVYMAYYNYLMKHIDKRNKDNFYSAEYALDIINAGLQKDISDSMSEAYVKAMKNSANMDADTMTVYFKNYYTQNLQARICDPSDTNKWLATHLTDMWEAADLIHATSAGDKGAYLEAIGGNNSLTLTNTDYFTIKNVKIVYTNDDGYISMIETDIRLKVPDLDFAQSASKLNLEEFSLVANNSLINDLGNLDDVPTGISVNKGSTSLDISGSVYGGKKGVQVGNQANIDFIKDPTDDANGLDLTYNLISKSIDLDKASDATSGVNINEKYNTFVENINVTSSNFNGDGNMYVGDDLDIAGRNSKVVLKGHYRGYGNENTVSKGSSSILINGANTTLDFSKLDELVLSGHAYVGAKKYDADKDRLAMGSLYHSKTAAGVTLSGNALIEAVNNKVLNSDKIEDEQAFDGQYEDMLGSDEYEIMTSAKELAGADIVPQNTSDIMMGESMSVKANQLFYMVPLECVGYIKGTDEQIVTKNPMTIDEYNKLLNTPDKESEEYKKYEKEFNDNPLNTGKTFDITKTKANRNAYKYEPVRLSVLWTEMGTASYTNNYKAVYRRINGSVMVYLYLDFSADENLANEFYRAYCEYAPDSVNLYVNSYIKDLKWNRNLVSQLTLAGNLFYLNNNDEVVVIKDSNQNSTKYLNMGLWQEEYSNKHTALMHTLKDNYDAMSSAQMTSDVFENLVDVAALSNMESMSFIHNSIPADPSEISAYVGTKNIVYPSTSCPENTALIITSGDVYVDGNYDGLILAGGNIYICSRCSKITYNPTKVIKAMQLEYVDPILNTTTHVYDALGTSGQISYGVVTAGDSKNAIQLTDLITYQNWKKE